MKKKLYINILFIFIIALFIGMDNVSASIMWLDCENKKYECSDCVYDIKFAVLTNKDGNTEIRGISNTPVVNYKGNTQYPIFVGSQPLKLDGHWLNEGKDINKDVTKQNATEIGAERLYQGICPVAIRTERDKLHPMANYDLILAGTMTPSPNNIKTIEEPEYIFYSIFDDKNKLIIGEGYDISGKYAYINRNFYNIDKYTNYVKTFGSIISAIEFFQSTDVIDSQYRSIKDKGNGENFYRVSTNFNSLYVHVSDLCESKDDCVDKVNYTLILDSQDSNEKLKNTVQEWYDKESSNLNTLSETFGKILDNKTFIEKSEEFNEKAQNGKKYKFNSSYSVNDMIEDLTNSYNSLEELSNKTFNFTDYIADSDKKEITPLASAMTYIYKNVFNINAFDELLVTGGEILNEDILRSMLEENTSKEIQKISSDGFDVLNYEKDRKKYVLQFLTTVSYLYENADSFGIGKDQKEELKELKEQYQELGKKFNIVVVVNCEDLIGEELIAKINSYLKIIKIAIPIILIGFGIFDFAKATFAGSEDDMKKAQQDFIKRLIIAVIIFFVPTIVNLILKIANEVWPIISPNTCGLG